MRRIILSFAALLIAGHAFAQKTVYHDAAGLTVIGKAIPTTKALPVSIHLHIASMTR